MKFQIILFLTLSIISTNLNYINTLSKVPRNLENIIKKTSVIGNQIVKNFSFPTNLVQTYSFGTNYVNQSFKKIENSKSKVNLEKYILYIYLFFVVLLFIYSIYVTINLIKEKKKWKKLLQIDKLTGLPNKHTFFKKILTTPFSRAYIITLDVVNFRYINELYGHKVGDIILKDLAQKLKKSFKNAYISRLSGNTFGIFIPDKFVDIEEIKKQLENLKIEIKLKDQHIEYSPKFTIGVYFIDNLNENKYEWKKNFASTLDYIIFESKKRRKGDIYLYETKKDIRVLIKENLEKQSFLEKKIKEDNIIAYFQPIVYSDTLKPFAFECLARIKDGNKVLPAKIFIDIATESGLVTKIDLKMLEYISKVRDMIPLKLFINLSPKSLYEENIIKKVSFNFKNCIFEITEQHIIQNVDLLKQLARIYKKTFAIDDFGSEFFSLKTLIDLVSEGIIKYLKIDGSLIQNITNDTYKQYVVKTIVAMAKKMNLKTIAEHVENKETVDILRKMGVDYLQGFYIGKPMPLMDAIKYTINKS